VRSLSRPPIAPSIVIKKKKLVWQSPPHAITNTTHRAIFRNRKAENKRSSQRFGEWNGAVITQRTHFNASRCCELVLR
jgi:hypothetical protein